MLESENWDGASAGCNENGLKHWQTETSYVVSGHKKSIGAASRSDWKMENEKLKVELKYLEIKKKHLLKQKNKLESILSSSIRSGVRRKLLELEPYLLERTKQHCDFEKRVKAMKITWSNTVEDVLEMIKPTKEEYPLLEIYDVRNIVKGDILRMNYYGFKDAFNNKPNFDDEELKGIFESARHYLMKAVYDVMADMMQGKNPEEEPVTEDMKKSILSSIEENDESDQLNEYEAPTRQYYTGLGFELPREN
ncbi:hypothetical protein QJS10_CPB17g02412 [Acorus calamus]|uniref:Uncharacterized protein n=1 Tax=Acorus calamus TaxID=4465 RepID=A0AAV9CRR6_ACOCL|nr:hypothetical protein QJS10_CPB17g02412 [Acorus calamus]